VAVGPAVSDPYGLAEAAAQQLRRAAGIDSIDLAVVLGSGWAAALDSLPVHTTVAMAALPGFREPTAAGHRAEICLGPLDGRTVAVLAGRTHFYEDRDVAAVVHGVRTLAAAGCRGLVLTNAAGSLRAQWPPGTPVLIADHLNLTGASPLLGPRFVDLTDAYAERLRTVARTVRPGLPEGVYAQFAGPQYETPAEVRMAGILGADLVGMSTALEAIAARDLGMEVLGVSLVTNVAAGLSDAAVAHADVLAVGRAAAGELGALLDGVLRAWPR
jgi:purine-nucleoside phosphorylase